MRNDREESWKQLDKSMEEKTKKVFGKQKINKKRGHSTFSGYDYSITLTNGP